MKSFVYLMKREFWEHRGFWIAPIILAGLMLLAYLAGLVNVATHDMAMDTFFSEIERAREAKLGILMASVLYSTGSVFFFVLFFMVGFYLIDSLYGERKDKSILFWKSMPVTDTGTVLSKLATGLITGPAMTFGVMIVFQLVVILLGAFWLLIVGGSPWALVFQPAAIFGAWTTMIAGVLAYGLWYMPFAGWLLLTSAWARKWPHAWAVLPPVAIGLVELLVFDSGRFFKMIGQRFAGPITDIDSHGDRIRLEMFDSAFEIDGGLGPTFEIVGAMFTSSGMWMGLLIGGGFVGGAIWLRRYRDDS